MNQTEPHLRLSDLALGESAVITGFSDMPEEYHLKLLSLGLLPGTRIDLEYKAPLGCPVAIRVRGVLLGLRAFEAEGLCLSKEGLAL